MGGRFWEEGEISTAVKLLYPIVAVAKHRVDKIYK